MWLFARVMLFSGVTVLLFFIQNGAHSAQPLLWVPKSTVLRILEIGFGVFICSSFVHDKGTRKEGLGFSISLKTDNFGFVADSKCIHRTTDVNKSYKNQNISWDSHFRPILHFFMTNELNSLKLGLRTLSMSPSSLFLLPLLFRISVPSRHELVNTQLLIPRAGTAPNKTGSAEGMDFSLMKYG